MFAVVILGVGFIMIAAVFPVAIRMNAQSAEETQGSVVAQRAVQVLQSRASSDLFPLSYDPSRYNPPSYLSLPALQYPPFVGAGESLDQTGNYTPAKTPDQLATALWSAVQGELVASTDGRTGFAFAYARSGPAPDPATGTGGSTSMRVIIVTAQARGERQRYNDTDSQKTGAGGAPADQSLWGKDVKIPPADTTTSYKGKAFVDVKTAVSGSLVPASNPPTPATLQFKRFEAAFAIPRDALGNPTGAPDRVRFINAYSGDLSAVGEGTYLIIANTQTRPGTVSPTNAPPARLNGWIFRVSKQVGRTTDNVWELESGLDMTAAQAAMNNVVPNPRPTGFKSEFELFDQNFDSKNNLVTSPVNTVQVLVLGKALRDPSKEFDAATNPYFGPVQDVSVYSAVIGIEK